MGIRLIGGGSMNEAAKQQNKQGSLDQLYDESIHWNINVGGETIHAKRMPGKFRAYKNIAWLFWIAYMVLPYIRINGQQLVLFDIPARQFYFFGATVYPQDIWMLSFALILLAMTLFGVTAVAGRVFCGYFCFQTVWTDWFVWIEEKIEGSPLQRRKLDKAPWGPGKISKRGAKYFIWSVISLLTGISFAAYFMDSYQLWIDLFTLQANIAAWITLLLFFLGTFILAGFMREQVCLWLCPYARIQSVMVDRNSIIPSYDVKRGEPRGKRKKGEDHSQQGDCIDCNQCVAVCPTGVDIRDSALQEGCIMCGLCIDACDSVMDKIGSPRGLIRYASENEMDGERLPPVYRRPRVITYTALFVISLAAIVYGLANIPPLEMHVVHERQPLYIKMSDGRIQNNYTFKILNKLEQPMAVKITVEGVEGLTMVDVPDEVILKPTKMVPFKVRLKTFPDKMEAERMPVIFTVQSIENPEIVEVYESFFVGPPR